MPQASDPASVLRTTQLVALAMLAAVVLLAVICVWLAPVGTTTMLDFPVAILGLASPVIGYRLWLARRDRLQPDASDEQRAAAFQQALILAAAVTEGAAMLGLVAHLLGGQIAPLIGVATHVLLLGAIWPTADRLQSFAGARTEGS